MTVRLRLRHAASHAARLNLEWLIGAARFDGRTTMVYKPCYRTSILNPGSLPAPLYDIVEMTDHLNATAALTTDGTSQPLSPILTGKKGTYQLLLCAVFQAAQQAWRDLKTVRRRTAKPEIFLYLVWTGFFLGLSIYLVIWNALNYLKPLCKPDGTFSLEPHNFNFWTAGFFKTSLFFGKFSFTEVKMLDVVFQLVRFSIFICALPPFS